MDTFDADSFMNSNVDAPMQTQMAKVPEGEYQAMIDNFDNATAIRTVQVKGIDRKILEIPFVIQDVNLQAKLKRDRVVHRESFWLDFDENGRLGTGPDQNINLGRLRAALDQNNAGWNPSMLKGAGPVMIVVKHKPNPQDSENPYVNISKYAKIS
jgi:hypothetical protein